MPFVVSPPFDITRWRGERRAIQKYKRTGFHDQILYVKRVGKEVKFAHIQCYVKHTRSEHISSSILFARAHLTRSN